MFFTNKFNFRGRKYFKKVFIFDIDPLYFYQQDTDLKILLEAMKAVSRYQNLLLVGKCWFQLFDSIRELINPNGRISIVSGSGSCYFDFLRKKISFFNFINRRFVDFITHLATSTTSGIIVQGTNDDQQNITNEENLITVSYFLNYLHAKEIKNKWKIKSNFGYDYSSFQNSIAKMNVSEIYFFENNFLTPLTSYFNYQRNVDFINTFFDSSTIRAELVSKFEQDAFAFTTNKNCIYDRILDFLEVNSITLDDVYYIATSSYDETCIKNFPNIILPSNMIEKIQKKPVFVYGVDDLPGLGAFLFENSTFWRITNI